EHPVVRRLDVRRQGRELRFGDAGVTRGTVCLGKTCAGEGGGEKHGHACREHESLHSTPPSSMVSSSRESASCRVLRRKRRVRSCFGLSSTSTGIPCSTIRPSSMKTRWSPTSRAN